MFSANMDLDWEPIIPSKPIEWTLERFIMQLPCSDQRYKDFMELKAEIAKRDELLDIAWGAVTEAGYKGYSRKLKSFMEQDDGT